MSITPFVRKEYRTVLGERMVHEILDALMEHSSLVVVDNLANPMGIISLPDIIPKPTARVKHCITPRPTINNMTEVDEVITLMINEGFDALCVTENGQLIGVVYKSDLSRFILDQVTKLRQEIKLLTHENRMIRHQLKIDDLFNSATAEIGLGVYFVVTPELKMYKNNRILRKLGRNQVNGTGPAQVMQQILRQPPQGFKSNIKRALQRESSIEELDIYYNEVATSIQIIYLPVINTEQKLKGVAIVMVDVTERNRQKKQLEHQRDLLNQISWIQSHQTRKPLATVLGLLGILDRSSLSEYNSDIFSKLDATLMQLDEMVRGTVILANRDQ